MKVGIFSNLNRTLSDPNRISSVDIFRGIAILAVVLVHFDSYVPYGGYGVDLFFVISGLLVGGLLTKQYYGGENIQFFRFFLRRGFKIWPSYYAFLILGTILAIFTYNAENASQIIPFHDSARYYLFYQNYTGAPHHVSFDHIWSLCVEEHFYILLPIMFIVLQKWKASNKALFSILFIVIILGFVFKVLMLYYTNGQDTKSATHNRIDALAWGVLLNLIITLYSKKIKEVKNIFIVSIVGLVGLMVSIGIDLLYESVFYHKVVFQSITPICFFLMILGVYYYDFSRFKALRIIGYYSYNWYLWHPVFVIIITQSLGTGVFALSVYLTISFLTAIFFTVSIEEPILAKRKQYVSTAKLHKKQ